MHSLAMIQRRGIALSALLYQVTSAQKHAILRTIMSGSSAIKPYLNNVIAKLGNSAAGVPK